MSSEKLVGDCDICEMRSGVYQAPTHFQILARSPVYACVIYLKFARMRKTTMPGYFPRYVSSNGFEICREASEICKASGGDLLTSLNCWDYELFLTGCLRQRKL